MNEIADESKREDLEKINILKEHLEDVVSEMVKEKRNVKNGGARSLNGTMIDKL